MKSFISKRILIGFNREQVSWLEREARTRRIPVAELVRRLVDARRERP